MSNTGFQQKYHQILYVFDDDYYMFLKMTMIIIALFDIEKNIFYYKK